MSKERILLGKQGEDCVVTYIKTLGFTLLAQNYKQRYGEIDIIAQKDEIIVFIEVKLRKTAYFALSELIPLSKQQKIIKTALYYGATNKLRDKIYRFDVALVEAGPDSLKLTYIDNAFTASSNLIIP